MQSKIKIADSGLYQGKREEMGKYRCSICQYIYDPDKGDTKGDIPAGTAFEDLPTDWNVPVLRRCKIQV
jgi:rubredoxin